jgi:endonuclease YncB( thermonuclease family)
MEKKRATCVYVMAGDTLSTNQVFLRLAGVRVPDLKTAGGQKAKSRLQSLVLNKFIIYEELGHDESGHILANVWSQGNNVNAYMMAHGYGAPRFPQTRVALDSPNRTAVQRKADMLRRETNP